MSSENNSTLDSVLRNWNIETIQEITKTTEGIVNTNWIITTTKKKYILEKLEEEVATDELNYEFKYLKPNKKYKYR